MNSNLRVEPERQRVTLHIEGMNCTNCALGISKFLEKKGFNKVQVNFATGIAHLDITEEIQINLAKKNVEKLGFHITAIDAPHLNADLLPPTPSKSISNTSPENLLQFFSKFSNTKYLLILSSLLSLPLLLSMFPWFAFLQDHYLQLALATPVFIIAWSYFGRSAYHSLTAGIANMDVLVILGVSAAFGFSCIAMYYPALSQGVYFETASIIITFVLLGKYLEDRAVQRTTTAIKELTQLQKIKAKRILKIDGDEIIEQIAADTLQKTDWVLVNTGDKVPADGKIVWGTAAIDESMISGESLPIEKSIGENVIGGTILQQGSVKIELTAVGKQTTLAQIIELVKTAQADQAPIQRLADRVSTIFVPAVTLIAICTFLIAYFGFQLSLSVALMNSVAVLVVACPCAMGLATPTAMMVGMGEVAKKGILIKGTSTIEKLAKLKQIVFDKTGTLTTGHFQIKQFNNLSPHTDTYLQSIVKTLEKYSSHPIAVSLKEAYKNAPKKILINIREQKGWGISGQDLDGNRYELGGYRMAQKATDRDGHQLYLLENGKLVATIDIEDELRTNLKNTLNELQKMGLQLAVLSGDRNEKVQALAEQVNIQKVYSEKLPHEKLEIITDLSNQSLVAMVGDGINDAPALAKANVGISMSNATQIAIQSAEVILLKGNLNLLPKTLQISRKILQIIQQNLFWAFFYNILMIPLAALGYLNPMLAAAAMSVSSIMVVGNSLRLKRV